MTPYLQQRALLFAPIGRRPSSRLGIVVVIPAYREPHLLLSLMALQRCELPNCDTEVLIVINDSEKDSDEIRQLNLAIAGDVKQWAATHNKFNPIFFSNSLQYSLEKFSFILINLQLLKVCVS